MSEQQQAAATKAQVKLAVSAGKLEDSAQEQTESADRRTELAVDRTVLAAERTYAAWVRTGLASLAAGVGARALLEDVIHPSLALATASLLVLFSAFCFVAGVWREMMKVAPPRPHAPRLPRILLLLVNGSLTLVSIAAIIGIWAS